MVESTLTLPFDPNDRDSILRYIASRVHDYVNSDDEGQRQAIVAAEERFEAQSLKLAEQFIARVKLAIYTRNFNNSELSKAYAYWKDKNGYGTEPLVRTGFLRDSSLKIVPVKNWRTKIINHTDFVKSYSDSYEAELEESIGSGYEDGLFLPHFGSCKVNVKYKKLWGKKKEYKRHFSYRQLWVIIEHGAQGVYTYTAKSKDGGEKTITKTINIPPRAILKRVAMEQFMEGGSQANYYRWINNCSLFVT